MLKRITLKCFKIDNSTDLYSYPILWIVIVFPLLVALVLVWWILISDDIAFCLSYVCLNKGVGEVFKVPIWIAGLGLVLGGFVVTIFGSRKTYLQFQETLRQNTFKNYIDHFDQFDKAIKRLEQQEYYEDIKPKIFQKESVYKRYFPENNIKRLDISAHASRRKESAVWRIDHQDEFTIIQNEKGFHNKLEIHTEKYKAIFSENTISRVASGDPIEIKRWIID